MHAIDAEYCELATMTRRIVFDLDGTLIDSSRDLAEAARSWCRNWAGRL